MANAADTKAVMTENLRDMGLDDESIAKCLQMVENGQYQELHRFLKSYRQTLLDSVHKYNYRIDCLDYFTYKLRASSVSFSARLSYKFCR